MIFIEKIFIWIFMFLSESSLTSFPTFQWFSAGYFFWIFINLFELSVTSFLKFPLVVLEGIFVSFFIILFKLSSTSLPTFPWNCFFHWREIYSSGFSWLCLIYQWQVFLHFHDFPWENFYLSFHNLVWIIIDKFLDISMVVFEEVYVWVFIFLFHLSETFLLTFPWLILRKFLSDFSCFWLNCHWQVSQHFHGCFWGNFRLNISMVDLNLHSFFSGFFI